MKLTPTNLVFNTYGTPYSVVYDDIYHSAIGAWGQANHVFLQGNRLPYRWAHRSQFVIVETGFGLGINFLATWMAWRNDLQRCQTLHFVSIEKHPFCVDDLRKALILISTQISESLIKPMSTTECTAMIHELVQQWPELTPGLHHLYFEQGQLVLTLALGDVAEVLPCLHLGADAFYLDGFSPRKNPEMWSVEVCKSLAKLAYEGATFATYSCASKVREHLQIANFVIQKQVGFSKPLNHSNDDKKIQFNVSHKEKLNFYIGKREMLHGYFSPPWQVRRYAPPVKLAYAEQIAIVIGGGIGGCAVASALAKKGWTVTIFDQYTEVAQGTSAHLRAAFHPFLTRDDNLMARAIRAGFQLLQHHAVIHRCGVLQVAASLEETNAWQKMLTNLGFDSVFARWVGVEEAYCLSGIKCAFGGIWYTHGGWASMPALCQAQIGTPGIQTQLNTRIEYIARHNGDWLVYAQSGRQLARAPVLILANALDALRLLKTTGLLSNIPDISATVFPLRNIRGQLSYVEPIGQYAALKSVLCGAGYILPVQDNTLIVGATYDEKDHDLNTRVSSHEENLRKLDLLIPSSTLGKIKGGFVGQRCVSLDRLPLIGAWPDVSMALKHTQRSKTHMQALPRCQGLYTTLALGSRGLIWSSLAGEILVNQIMGTPAPVEVDLLNALDPGRFLLRHLRKLDVACKSL